MSKKCKRKKQDFYSQKVDFSDFKAVSNQDCTGLIPSNPESKEALESYKQTYDYQAIKNDRN